MSVTKATGIFSLTLFLEPRDPPLDRGHVRVQFPGDFLEVLLLGVQLTRAILPPSISLAAAGLRAVATIGAALIGSNLEPLLARIALTKSFVRRDGFGKTHPQSPEQDGSHVAEIEPLLPEDEMRLPL